MSTQGGAAVCESAATALNGLLAGDIRLANQVYENKATLQSPKFQQKRTLEGMLFGSVRTEVEYDKPDGFFERMKQTQKSAEDGFLYIAHAKCFPGVVKIGYTEKDTKTRLASMSTAIPYGSMELVKEFRVPRARQFEKAVHSFMDGERVAVNKEWFTVAEDKLEEVYTILEGVEKGKDDVLVVEKALHHLEVGQVQAGLR